MEFKLEDIVECGPKPDLIRAWGPRMCFKYKQLAIDYHIPSKVFIIKQPVFSNFKISRYDVLHKGRVENKDELIKLIKQYEDT